MKTARQVAHAVLAPAGFNCVSIGVLARDLVDHMSTCNTMTAAIEARDAEHATALAAAVVKARGDALEQAAKQCDQAVTMMAGLKRESQQGGDTRLEEIFDAREDTAKDCAFMVRALKDTRP